MKRDEKTWGELNKKEERKERLAEGRACGPAREVPALKVWWCNWAGSEEREREIAGRETSASFFHTRKVRITAASQSVTHPFNWKINLSHRGGHSHIQVQQQIINSRARPRVLGEFKENLTTSTSWTCCFFMSTIVILIRHVWLALTIFLTKKLSR